MNHEPLCPSTELASQAFEYCIIYATHLTAAKIHDNFILSFWMSWAHTLVVSIIIIHKTVLNGQIMRCLTAKS